MNCDDRIFSPNKPVFGTTFNKWRYEGEMGKNIIKSPIMYNKVFKQKNRH